jgi:methyl-accepting chemotaxis protein
VANGIFGQKNFLPPSGEGLPVAERLGQLEDFIYKLQESLEHTLRNLDPKSNFNDSQTQGWSSELLTPVYNTVASAASDARQRIDALAGRVTTVEGDISSLAGRVTTVESDISSLAGRVTTVEGAVSGHTTSLADLTSAIEALDSGFDSRVEDVLTQHGLI